MKVCLCVTRHCSVSLDSSVSLNQKACARRTLTVWPRSSSPRRQRVDCHTTAQWNSLVTTVTGRWHRRRVSCVCRSLSTGSASVNCRANISSTSSALTSGLRYVVSWTVTEALVLRPLLEDRGRITESTRILVPIDRVPVIMVIDDTVGHVCLSVCDTCELRLNSLRCRNMLCTIR